MEFFKDRTVGEIWTGSREIVFFNSDETVGNCLKVLESKNIISAPVVDKKERKVLGIVDTQSILLFILGLYPKDVNLDDLTPSSFKEIIRAGTKFSDSPIINVVEVDNAFNPTLERVLPVTKDTPLEKLMDMFFLGVHRVPYIDENGELLDVISQSDLLRVLAQCIHQIGDVAHKTIEALGIVKQEILTAPETKTVISVIAEMQRNNVSAIPVVSKKTGEIIANFSASNLKDTGVYTFGEMLVPVYEFLSLKNIREKPFLVAIQCQKSLHPITCTKQSTFKEVVMEMVTQRIHRIWVVDSNKKPCGVVSIGDLFQVFLPWGSPNKFQ